MRVDEIRSSARSRLIGSGAKATSLHQFEQHATAADHEHRTHFRIALDTGDQLGAAVDLLADQDPV
jgi:hypothetical protein